MFNLDKIANENNKDDNKNGDMLQIVHTEC